MGATIRSDEVARLAPFVAKPNLPPATSEFPRVANRDFELDWGTSSDHARIHQLLVETFQEPSAAEFQALNNAPRYDPSDRILIRRDSEIVAHVQLIKRTIGFGTEQLVTMDIKHLTTLPEYRSRGLARQLHEAATDEMRRAGVFLATVPTRHPAFFAGMGWFPSGRFSYSEIRPSDFLAFVSSERPSPRRWGLQPESGCAVHVWRRNELDSLIQLYEQASQYSCGAVQRLESDWRWLIERGAYDHIYLVRETLGMAPTDDGGSVSGPVLGYAIVRDARILEFAVRDHDPRIQKALLSRVCRDAQECGRGSIAIHAAPDDPVHRLIRAAGGAHCLECRDGGRVVMAQVTKPMKLLSALRPILKRRAQQTGLSPMTLGLEFGEEAASITIGSRAVSIAAAKPTEDRLRLSPTALGQMLLGHHSAEELLENYEITAFTKRARSAASSLFPAVPLWRPRFDDEPA